MENQLYIREVALRRPIPGKPYFAALPAVRHLIHCKSLSFPAPVTFFVGENGTGKSTLLEAIAVAYGFNPEGGSKNFSFSTADSHSGLWQYLTLIKEQFAKDGFFLRAESFYNVATNIDVLDEIPATSPLLIQSYGGVSLHKQSHGESFFALLQNRFSGNGLYILDEPEAALSPMKQLALLREIHELVTGNSQFIIATHSPLLMAYPGAHLYQFTESGIASVPYQETEHYQVARRFLENPDRMLRLLLEE